MLESPFAMVAVYKKFLRFCHTAKHLQWRQVVYRGWYRLFPLKSISHVYDVHGVANWFWCGPEVKQPSMFDVDKVEFLNVRANIHKPEIWNSPHYDKLWLYNLHYFDDLNAKNNQQRTHWHYLLVKRWIQENPPFSGNGWEPYTISLRLVNWVQWYNRTSQDDAEIVRSINLQAHALIKQLEYHILGNHLFANAKALVFAGCFLQGSGGQYFKEKGLAILEEQVAEQFLSDGGHFERSPMYHCILLWDLLELLHLALLCKDPTVQKAAIVWRGYAERAIQWLQTMTHPDGEISFFNDAAMDISVSPNQVYRFAEELGVPVSLYSDQTTLDVSGYSRLHVNHHVVLFDHAPVGPDYLPGHAHADTLSFEWSVGAQRVLVNSGTSVYGVSQERLRQRQTAAHNTVVVDGADSSEVWGGFRVARRARTRLLQSQSASGVCVIGAEHDGYCRLGGDVVHSRELYLDRSQLRVTDRLSGHWHSGDAMFHLHPDISCESIESGIILSLPSGQKIIMKADAPLRMEKTSWHPKFGVSVPTYKIVISMAGSELKTSFSMV